MKLRAYGLFFGLFLVFAPACGDDDSTVDGGTGTEADAGDTGDDDGETPDAGGSEDAGGADAGSDDAGGGDAAVAPVAR
jgi:hypothetical protein